MKQQFRFIAKAAMLMVVFIFFQSFFKGGEYYKVLLNGRVVAEQYLTRPVALKTLSLNSSNQNDQLSFYYSHCGRTGSNRSIALKNVSGKVLKEWKFDNTNSQEMQVPVKEVLQASSKNSTASIYYSSKELPAGRMLITLDFSAMALAKH